VWHRVQALARHRRLKPGEVGREQSTERVVAEVQHGQLELGRADTSDVPRPGSFEELTHGLLLGQLLPSRERIIR